MGEGSEGGRHGRTVRGCGNRGGEARKAVKTGGSRGAEARMGGQLGIWGGVGGRSIEASAWPIFGL